MNPKHSQSPSRPQPSHEEPTQRPSERPAFKAPKLRNLGTLPVVTTAFGGSFSP